MVYPPVDLERYYNGGDGGYYLHLCRLDEKKEITKILRASGNTDHELVLAGGEGDAGTETYSIIDSAPNIDYRGFVAESKKYELLAYCRAVVFSGHNEDFGIVPVEANSSEKPCLERNDGFP